MKNTNIFYIKNIVDDKITDDTKRVLTQKIVEEVKNKIVSLSDDDFVEVMISCFIPDTYRDQGKKEKLYTKLSELVVGEWWRRMGGTYVLPTKRSGTEDVEMILNDISVVCDSKIFRLGRSQKAPNVKDFLKLASVMTWINNLKKKYDEENKKGHSILGGLVTYSSFHEWEKDSEVYQECSNPNTSVLMLPYEVLALLLKYKGAYALEDFLGLWDYKKIGMEESKKKTAYWKTVESFLCGLLNIDAAKYKQEIKLYRDMIIKARDEYRKLVENDMKKKKAEVENVINAFSDMDELKQHVITTIDKYENAKNRDYLERIDQFRKYD
jgi:hypothetical protein